MIHHGTARKFGVKPGKRRRGLPRPGCVPRVRGQVPERQNPPPGVKGDTAQGAGNKPATLETGLVVQVPLFVNEGDYIKIDTREDGGRYIERVKK